MWIRNLYVRFGTVASRPIIASLCAVIAPAALALSACSVQILTPTLESVGSETTTIPPATARPDLTAPEIAAQNPPAGAVGVSGSTPVTVTFDKAMDASTETPANFVVTNAAGDPVSGTLSISTNAFANDTLTFGPASRLPAGETFTVALASGLKDSAGNSLASTSRSFTTANGSAPALAQINVNEGPSGTDTATATLAQNWATGNLLVVGVFWNYYPTVTVSDTSANTWHPLTIYGVSNGTYIQLWYAQNVVGGTNTVTVTGLGAAPGPGYPIGVFLAEYSGVAADAFDAESGLTAPTSSNSMSAGNLSVTGQSLVVSAFYDANGGGTMTPGAGFTSQATDTGAYSMFEDSVIGAGTIMPTANLPGATSDSDWQGAAAAFHVY